MQVRHFTDTQSEPVEGVPGVTIRWVVSKIDGAPNFAMRVFEIEPSSSSPYHQHEWEHEVFVLSGEGAAVAAETETPIGHGSVVFVPPMEMHQFVNRGTSVLRFICVVPL